MANGRSPLRDQTLASLTTSHDVTVMARLPHDGEPQFLLEIDASSRLRVGDHVVFCGEPPAVAPLLRTGNEGDAASGLWKAVRRRRPRSGDQAQRGHQAVRRQDAR